LPLPRVHVGAVGFDIPPPIRDDRYAMVVARGKRELGPELFDRLK
jgi:hypothetical protein